MTKRQTSGFTLIEILAVVVIIAVLATIALPRLGRARERAEVVAVVSDLKNLVIQQELYRTRTGSYAWSLPELSDVTLSEGVTLTITMMDGGRGWAAVARHARMPRMRCGVFFGSDSAAEASPAVVAGIVACTDIPKSAPSPEEPDEKTPGGTPPITIQEPEAAPVVPPR